MSKTIVIEISSGCLTNVSNLPEGWSYNLLDWDNISDEVADAEICSLCKGTGETDNGELCPTCNGDGYVDTWPER